MGYPYERALAGVSTLGLVLGASDSKQGNRGSVRMLRSIVLTGNRTTHTFP